MKRTFQKYRTFILSFFILNMVLACGDEDNSICVNTSSDFPYLTVGNQWVYNLFEPTFDSVFIRVVNDSTDPPTITQLLDTVLINLDTLDTLDLTVEISQDIGNGIFFVTFTDTSKIFPEDNYWNACSGYIARLEDLESDPRLNRFSKSSYTIGETWEAYDSFLRGIYTVADTNVNVTVPAGTFSCTQIFFALDNTNQVDTIYETNEQGVIKYSGLISYELKEINF